jgi:hypothetical protein
MSVSSAHGTIEELRTAQIIAKQRWLSSLSGARSLAEACRGLRAVLRTLQPRVANVLMRAWESRFFSPLFMHLTRNGPLAEAGPGSFTTASESFNG